MLFLIMNSSPGLRAMILKGVFWRSRSTYPASIFSMAGAIRTSQMIVPSPMPWNHRCEQ